MELKLNFKLCCVVFFGIKLHYILEVDCFRVPCLWDSVHFQCRDEKKCQVLVLVIESVTSNNGSLVIIMTRKVPKLLKRDPDALPDLRPLTSD